MNEKFEIFNPESFYQAPKHRIDNPLPAPYDRGDIVEILEGPVKGRLGKVVVERNGNYKDFEPYANEESIGVAVVERIPVNPNLENMVKDLIDPESRVHTVVIWCDGEESEKQLRLYKKTKPVN